jgi:hypothetical protein
MAGKIIADIIEAPYDSIRMNVANVTVLTANSSGLTYLPTGNVNINIGGTSANLTMNLLTANGIKFPATQVSSADGNTLDDYEEGTWTPVYQEGTISGTSISYIGRYTKVGNLVTLFFQASSDSGNLQVSSYVGFSGIPFASARNGTSTVVTEDIDVFARQGFITVGSGLFLSACGSSSGTGALRGTVTYFTS